MYEISCDFDLRIFYRAMAVQSAYIYVEVCSSRKTPIHSVLLLCAFLVSKMKHRTTRRATVSSRNVRFLALRARDDLGTNGIPTLVATDRATSIRGSEQFFTRQALRSSTQDQPAGIPRQAGIGTTQIVAIPTGARGGPREANLKTTKLLRAN